MRSFEYNPPREVFIGEGNKIKIKKTTFRSEEGSSFSPRSSVRHSRINEIMSGNKMIIGEGREM